MKKLIKRALLIIMATMMVTSITAVEATAVASEKGTVSTYVNQETGVKVESEAIALSGDNVEVQSGLGTEDLLGEYEERFDITIYDEDFEFLDCRKYPITLYLPYEKEGCYIVADTGVERGEEIISVDAEYVDGYYKIEMADWGEYYICDFPFEEGFSKLEQQTLVDEDTGISVSGSIETGSRLVSFDTKDMYNELLNTYGDDKYISNYVDMSQKFDGFGVFLERNFDYAYTDGEMTITLPSEYEGYEVRCFSYSAPMSSEDSDLSEAYGFSLYTIPDPSDEELAVKLTEFIDRVYPPLQTEYVDGKYVVKNTYTGYYYIAPAGSFVVTADDVKRIRTEAGIYDDYESDYQEPTDAPTQTATDATTDATDATDATNATTQTATQASTQTATHTPTQVSTATQSNGSVKTSDSRNIAIILSAVLVVGLGTATMAIFRKRSTK